MIDSGDDAPGGKSDNLSVGEKRKHAELELDVEFGSNDEVVLWRANFEEFIRCLRHKACVENATARLDDEAAVVLRAMLKATRTAEKKVKTENSVPLSQNTIYEEVINSEAGRSLTMGCVRDSLSGLCDSSSERDVDEDESYSAGCFALTSSNPSTANQNMHAYGIMLIAALSTLLLIIYNCSDQVLTTRGRRLAKSREAAARSARETAKAQQR
ncbi:DNA-directed RNA polymerase III subunit RPC3 isoform X2 [Prunus yedoensis var. nudiflora]|uniref:DNA-directed RNA polymerase III subunit RPC3 n=1 Tax=Prunus yedoensis var. nudiflora TaxID=2094558 RepID=A0A314UZ59_PRUYE|nr:DNA-directed RNA polymerase III subunit RPC3 isoform X2 [Prunus yedoensis var. nudiflora]